jgi:hypothetical protein
VAPGIPTQRVVVPSLPGDQRLDDEDSPSKIACSQAVRRWTVSAYRSDLSGCDDARSMNVGTTSQQENPAVFFQDVGPLAGGAEPP